jgi:GNAT superfamily N-acetyltransferase
VVNIAPAQPDDTNAIADLMDELNQFYGETTTEPLEERSAQIRDALFSDPPAAHALLAWEGSTLIGFASYSFLWPAAGLTRSLYLKELYVSEAHRRSGVGSSLMTALFEVAEGHRCSRVEWMTETENTSAQQFYEGFEVKPHAGKLFYRRSMS